MRVKSKRRGRLRRGWLPWHAFTDLGLNWQQHDDNVRDMSPRDVRHNALILLAAALVIGTCLASSAAPRLSLVIDLTGGLVVSIVVLTLTGQWQELRRGLRETGQWPEPGVQFEMMRHYILGLLLQAQERRLERRTQERIERHRARHEEARQ